MKTLFYFLFVFTLAGCMHYATPHGQDITIKNIEKLPVKVGLYLPESISRDSVEVDIGDYWNWTHLFILRSGSSIATAISKSIAASVNEVVILDSLSYQQQTNKDSLAFIIFPEVIRRNATIWPSAWNFFKNYGTSTFESQLKLNLTDKHGALIDSILINAVGVSGRILDSSHVVDSVIADAADSAIASMQDQIVYNLTRNNKLRSYLGLPNPANDIAIVTPAHHGLYGTTLQFELDTNSYVIRPIPPVRRWSEWIDEGINTDYPSDVFDMSIGVDLLLQSRFSIKLSLFLMNYVKRTDSYFSFTELKFIDTDPVVIIDWGLLTQASYLFLGPRFFAEAGVGLNTIFGTGFTGRINIPGLQRFQPSGIVGFRYQSVLGGICIGASYTPYFNLRGFQNHISLSTGFAF